MKQNVYFTITNQKGQVVTQASNLQDAVNYIRHETTPRNPLKLHLRIEYFETISIY